MNEPTALSALSALTHPLRLRTVRHLMRAAPHGLSAGEIATRIDASPSKTSFHLNLLSDAGLITSTRQSRRILYAANLKVLGSLLGYLIEDCCDGHPVVRECCGVLATGGPSRSC